VRRAAWAAGATAFAALLLWAGGARTSAPDREVVPAAAAKPVATAPIPLPAPAPTATVVRPGRESPHGLGVVATFDGAHLDVKGVVDLPDGAVLSLSLTRSQFGMRHDKRGCVIDSEDVRDIGGEILKALGPRYQNWSRSFSIFARDAREVVQRLSADSRAGRAILARLRDARARTGKSSSARSSRSARPPP